MNQGFAVVDFETTGLSPAKGDRAIEIGLVHVAPDGTLEDEHATLIHVDRSVGASWVHHITARDLLHAPDVYGQINVYGVTTKSERHKRSYWTRTADGNGIGGRKAPVPYGS